MNILITGCAGFIGFHLSNYLLNKSNNTIYGIDVINDKRNWKIIEINPRFTSTFCGISRSYGQQADKLIRDFYIYKEKIFFRKLKFIRKTKVLF